MLYAALGLAAAMAFGQSVPEEQPVRSTINANNVWKTVEFVPDRVKSLEPRGTGKVFSVHPSKPEGPIELTFCSKMPIVTVDQSVDSKIIVPASATAPKPHVRMVGREMPACRNR